MKSILLVGLFAILFAAQVVMGADSKFQKTPKACELVCTMEYEPICAGDPQLQNEKPKSFGSLCVMKNYNCQNNANLVMISKGECPGSTGVRLS